MKVTSPLGPGCSVDGDSFDDLTAAEVVAVTRTTGGMVEVEFGDDLDDLTVVAVMARMQTASVEEQAARVEVARMASCSSGWPNGDEPDVAALVEQVTALTAQVAALTRLVIGT